MAPWSAKVEVDLRASRQADGRLGACGTWVMVKRIAPVRVVSFVLLAACGAVCQSVRQSLPDAPSVQTATRAQKFNVFVGEARSPLKFGAMGGKAS
jgi:hypothetical protein